jgi:predicted pyridoxine 5'-phosphate oxidase superfamily flavin-nucleotide-binding protein
MPESLLEQNVAMVSILLIFMDMSYEEIAFSEAAKKLQIKHGSRQAYSQKERLGVRDGFSENEKRFIAEQDHFMMATVGENGFPYVQHRGGPKGFIKILDDQTLGIIDFAGNKQYISVGNLQTNSKVALMLLSYANQARLKIYAEAKVMELADNLALFDKLALNEYKHRPERMLIFEVKAFDWNCPQHITPRYTTEEFREIMTN